MRMKTETALLCVGALLGLSLAAVWLRGIPAWDPPTPVIPDAEVLAAAEVYAPQNSASALPQTISRPLLSADRKPHPQELTQQAAPPEPDPFEKIVLNGIFGAGGSEGGVIVKTEDKVKRLKIGESLGSWRLTQVLASEARFENSNKEKRSLVLKYLTNPQEKNPAGQPPGIPTPPTAVPDLPPAVPINRSKTPRRANRTS